MPSDVLTFDDEVRRRGGDALVVLRAALVHALVALGDLSDEQYDDAVTSVVLDLVARVVRNVDVILVPRDRRQRVADNLALEMLRRSDARHLLQVDDRRRPR